MKIALFASGKGSNVKNIINYFKHNSSINVQLILSNNLNSGSLQYAKDNNIKSYVFNKSELANNIVLDIMSNNNIDLIVLAGFLLKIPEKFIKEFNGNIINIHPSLLPKYGGKGMYGENVHKAVIKNKEKESGITIHYVNENYDQGNIIFQKTCIINKTDTHKDIAKKIHTLEYKYFPEVIQKLALKNSKNI